MDNSITLVMTTYITNKKRAEVVEETLYSWRDRLISNGQINLHVADDQSSLWDPELFTYVWDRGDVTFSVQQRRGVGASLNTGFKKAFKISPIVLYAVDDWTLTELFNITPFVKLLTERENVGCVRLGPPHPNLTGKIEMLTSDWQGWGLRLDKSGLVVAQRPALWHKRMIDSYGWFSEGTSALECERLYNEHFCQTKGPDCVLCLPHPWYHLESESLSSLTP